MTTAQIAFNWTVGLYWLSALIAMYVFRVRAGLSWWSGFHITGPGGVGVGWTTLTTIKAFSWPLVLALWVSTGKPEPRIVFNDKAEARQQETLARQQEAAAQLHASQTRAMPAAPLVPAEPVTTPIRIPPAVPPAPRVHPTVGRHAAAR